MTVRQSDKKKKWLSCLRCGQKMWTDRCHRICRRCTIANRRSQYAGSPTPMRLNVGASRSLTFADVDW